MINKKNQFPIFEKLPNLVYLDNGATTLKPKAVLEKINEYYTEYSANIHRGVYQISERATEEYELVREKVKQFIGGSGGEVIFTKGATDGLNLVARGWGDANLKEGDEIAVGMFEHHSNLVPWQQLAKRKKLKINLFRDNFEEAITSKTKLLAICQVGNVLGQVNNLQKIVEIARKINPEILIVVDGAQGAGHRKVSIADTGVDFYAISGHKMYGPTGVGVLWGKKARVAEIEPISFGGGMIAEVSGTEANWAVGVEKFEAGTPAIGEVIGLGAAVDWLSGLGMENIEKEEEMTAKYLYRKVNELEFVKVISHGESGIISFNVNGVHPHDVATILDRDGVAVRAGHHCAMPLHTELGIEASVRVSLGIYNSMEDIDKLISGLKNVWTIFTKK